MSQGNETVVCTDLTSLDEAGSDSSELEGAIDASSLGLSTSVERRYSTYLSVQRRLKSIKSSWVFVEALCLLKLGFPVLLMTMTQQALFFISLLYVGHTASRSLELDSAALAITFVNVWGVSLIYGITSGADTLSSQAYGFKNYKRVGIILQRGILILAVAVMPVVVILINAESLLLLIQQDPCVAKLSGEYLQIFILALPGVIVFVAVMKYLQSQSVVWVLVFVGVIGNIVSAVLHAGFLFGAKLGILGASLSLVLTNTIVPVLLVLYIRVRGIHKLTWGGWSWASLQDWWQYSKLGLAGFAMNASEWWAFEISTFVTGSIDKTQLAVNSIIIQFGALIFMLPLGMGTAASIRVGNELGAGNPMRAKRASFVAVGIMVCSGAVLVVLFGILRRQLAYVFTSVSEVVDGVENAMLGALGVMFLDQIQGTVSGILRGCGRQAVGALVNFLSYYLIGLPLGISLAIRANMGTLGMWIGLSVADAIQTTTLIIILLRTNWKKLSDVAMMNAKDDTTATSTDDDVSSTDVDLNDSSKADILASKQDWDESSLNNESEEVPLVSSDGSDDESTPPPLATIMSHHTRKTKLKLVVFRGSFFLVGALLIVLGAVLTQYHPCSIAATTDCSNCSSSCCFPCANDSVCSVEPAASSSIQPIPATLMMGIMPSSVVIVSQTETP